MLLEYLKTVASGVRSQLPQIESNLFKNSFLNRSLFFIGPMCRLVFLSWLQFVECLCILFLFLSYCFNCLHDIYVSTIMCAIVTLSLKATCFLTYVRYTTVRVSGTGTARPQLGDYFENGPKCVHSVQIEVEMNH